MDVSRFDVSGWDSRSGLVVALNISDDGELIPVDWIQDPIVSVGRTDIEMDE